MQHFNLLSEKLQKRIELKETKNGRLTAELTVSHKNGELFFLTNIFKDGSLLGFWSRSPWGGVRNEEEGWAVLSEDLEILDSCETRTSGQPAGNDYLSWRKKQTEQHGKSCKLMPEYDNSLFWKISEC